jgi:hypothetical protein
MWYILIVVVLLLAATTAAATYQWKQLQKRDSQILDLLAERVESDRLVSQMHGDAADLSADCRQLDSALKHEQSRSKITDQLLLAGDRIRQHNAETIKNMTVTHEMLLAEIDRLTSELASRPQSRAVKQPADRKSKATS